jgi:ornithine carbamoyltransferase
MVHLKQRSFLSLAEARGKNLALIFEKTWTRTRSGFEVAAFDQGAHVSYIGPHDSSWTPSS